MKEFVCRISGKSFSASELEMRLREKLDVPAPQLHPRLSFRLLLSFWQHFALHRRKCEKTGKNIISVFDENCPYPVWYRDDWISDASPPNAEYDFSKPFFSQLWDLFQKCPIPHNVGLGNENCEYIADWFYSKNCYLCHSGIESEDCCYSYRTFKLKNCQYCVYTFESELCRDLVNCENCFSVNYAVNSKKCRDSAFLFDCRRCHDCLLCWNLRDKSYCIENKQYSKEEYFERIKDFNFSSRSMYHKVESRFKELVKENAFWRGCETEQLENSTGAYLEKAKNSEDCFFATEVEDCVRFIRGIQAKDCIDATGPFRSELLYYTTCTQDRCYDVRYSYSLLKSRFMEYCGFCFNCENCFACCGLTNKKYCILNKKYSPEKYHQLVGKIKEAIKKEGLEGSFFPPYFAPNTYEESLASFYFPLSIEEQQSLSYRVNLETSIKTESMLTGDEIPDSAEQVDDSIFKQVFWDSTAKKPFQIKEFDLKFAKKNNVPLPDCYYMRRMKELFSWMHFSGELRETICAISGERIKTNLPESLDGKILGDEAYRREIN